MGPGQKPGGRTGWVLLVLGQRLTHLALPGEKVFGPPEVVGGLAAERGRVHVPAGVLRLLVLLDRQRVEPGRWVLPHAGYLPAHATARPAASDGELLTVELLRDVQIGGWSTYRGQRVAEVGVERGEPLRKRNPAPSAAVESHGAVVEGLERRGLDRRVLQVAVLGVQR